MQITLSIPNGQAADFQKYYSKRRPVPLNGEEQPIMSFVEWVKENAVNDLYDILLAGKQMESLSELREQITIDIT